MLNRRYAARSQGAVLPNRARDGIGAKGSNTEKSDIDIWVLVAGLEDEKLANLASARAYVIYGESLEERARLRNSQGTNFINR